MRADRPSGPGPVAVVTGASRGIGAGLAVGLAAAGWRLALASRTLPAAPAGADVLTTTADVADPAAVDDLGAAAVARFGRIDLWVNNAGILEPIGPLADADPADLARHVATNLLGVLHGSATFARHVRTRPGGGLLVNVSSGAATRAYRGWAAYCASKAAVDAATAVVAAEEAGAGLVAVALSPGVVDTAMQAAVRATPPTAFPDGDRFRALHREAAFTPLGAVTDAVLALWAGRHEPAAPPGGPGDVRRRVGGAVPPAGGGGRASG